MAFVIKKKFRGGIGIFVKVEICYILSHFAIPHLLKVGFASTQSPIKGSLMLCNICTYFTSSF